MNTLFWSWASSGQRWSNDLPQCHWANCSYYQEVYCLWMSVCLCAQQGFSGWTSALLRYTLGSSTPLTTKTMAQKRLVALPGRQIHNLHLWAPCLQKSSIPFKDFWLTPESWLVFVSVFRLAGLLSPIRTKTQLQTSATTPLFLYIVYLYNPALFIRHLIVLLLLQGLFFFLPVFCPQTPSLSSQLCV